MTPVNILEGFGFCFYLICSHLKLCQAGWLLASHACTIAFLIDAVTVTTACLSELGTRADRLSRGIPVFTCTVLISLYCSMVCIQRLKLLLFYLLRTS